ncbi:MAG: DUF4438 domain-containing protein [Desulfovermiculus sp.]
MFLTNQDYIVEFLLECKPGPPRTPASWSLGHEGSPFILPAIGGITLNVQVGDSAFGWAGDHIEPGVSCTGNTNKPQEHPNTSLQMYACIGNKAAIVSGEAKGGSGVVIGKHGGSEHLIVDFPREVKEKLSYEDTIRIQARGQGLQLTNHPEISLFNLAPELLAEMDIEIRENKIRVPVTTMVPAVCIGSGIGAPHVAKGDCDIITSDPHTVQEHKLDRIRFGDFVALLDQDHRFGRTYRQGAISIGVISHSDCKRAGHGPGVTTVMTADNSSIEPVISSRANIADILGIGTRI